MSDLLSPADVEQVARLVESLDRSTFDHLELRVGDLEVVIGKGAPPTDPASVPSGGAPPGPAPAAPAAEGPAAAPIPAAAPTPAAAPPDGLLAITTPTMGIFYAQPEPGRPPFVTVGSVVEETTTVALVEVMKTFHAVAAGVRGTVVEVCVEDAAVVELGDVLFRVEPAGRG